MHFWMFHAILSAQFFFTPNFSSPKFFLMSCGWSKARHNATKYSSFFLWLRAPWPKPWIDTCRFNARQCRASFSETRPACQLSFVSSFLVKFPAILRPNVSSSSFSDLPMSFCWFLFSCCLVCVDVVWEMQCCKKTQLPFHSCLGLASDHASEKKQTRNTLWCQILHHEGTFASHKNVFVSVVLFQTLQGNKGLKKKLQW